MTLFKFNFGLYRVAPSSSEPWNRLKSLTLLVLVALAASSVCGVVASAQVDAGQIAGTVVDQSGAVIPDASVTVRNLATNVTRAAVSSSTGAYLVTGLEPGNYQLTVTSGSFKPFAPRSKSPSAATLLWMPGCQ